MPTGPFSMHDMPAAGRESDLHCPLTSAATISGLVNSQTQGIKLSLFHFWWVLKCFLTLMSISIRAWAYHTSSTFACEGQGTGATKLAIETILYWFCNVNSWVSNCSIFSFRHVPCAWSFTVKSVWIFWIPEILEIEIPQFSKIKLFKNAINLQKLDKPEILTSRLYMHFGTPHSRRNVF